jgi:F0F1-type ATP synthase assembly protein I
LFLNRTRQTKAASEPAEPWSNGSASYEFVASPVVLSLLGLWLDRTVGTTPLFCVIGAVLGLVGATIKIYYGYRHRMAQLAEQSPWSGMRSVTPRPAATRKGTSR